MITGKKCLPGEGLVDRRLRTPGDWYDFAMATYSRRKLTYPSDRLSAFMGIVNHLAPDTWSEPLFDALCGLFPLQWAQGGGIAGLLWNHGSASDTLAQRIPPSSDKSRALPSWSWVGWSGSMSCGPVVHLTPVLLNENSIKLVLSQLLHTDWMWPYEPKPCEISKAEGTILHIWAPLLVARPVPEDYAKRSDTVRFVRNTLHRTLSVVLPQNLPCPSTEELHEFLLIDTLPPPVDISRWMMIKRISGTPFHERLHLVWEAGSSLRSFDRAEFRHIKLI